MKKVFIVILNFNGKKDTLQCLESLKTLSTINYQLSIIVVDNGSSDGSVEKLKELIRDYSRQFASGTGNSLRKKEVRVPHIREDSRKPPIKLLENRINLGFAAGNNVGIKYALKNGADYVIVLNNDTVVPKNFLELLENEADIVGPVIKFKRNREWVYDYGGYLNWWLGRPKHHELSSCTLTPNPYPLTYLSGCCLAIKRQVFEKIGLLDERFFLYFEDVDFCLRAKKAGFKIALDPNVVIFHKLGGSAGRWSETAICHNIRSNFIFITKHLGWRRPIGYLYLMLLGIKIIISNIHLGGVHSTFAKASVDKSATSEVLRRPK